MSQPETVIMSAPSLSYNETISLIMSFQVQPMGSLLGALGNRQGGQGRRLSILCMLILNPGMTQASLAKSLNMSPAAMQRQFWVLREAGIISVQNVVNVDLISELSNFLASIAQIATDYKSDKFRRDLPCQVELTGELATGISNGTIGLLAAEAAEDQTRPPHVNEQ